MSIEYREVRAWAIAQPANSPIGEPCNAVRCPFAAFLASLHQAVYYVGERVYGRTDDSSTMMQIPSWVRTAILLIDGQPEGPILREKFLDILDEAMRLEAYLADLLLCGVS